MVKNADNSLWTLPGGAVEDGEFVDVATIREVKEETGSDIRLHGIVAVNEAILSEHVCFFTFRAEIVGGSCEVSRPKNWCDKVI